jgi:Flp pilus assembly protein TadG
MTRTIQAKPSNAACRSIRNRRGGAVLELSIAMLTLTYVCMGGIEAGQLFYSKHTIQSAARDACRAAILRPTSHANVGQSVQRTLKSAGLDKSGYVVKVSDPISGAAIADVNQVKRGELIAVTVSAKFGKLGARPLGVIDANKDIIGSTTMVKE